MLGEDYNNRARNQYKERKIGIDHAFLDYDIYVHEAMFYDGIRYYYGIKENEIITNRENFNVEYRQKGTYASGDT